MPQLTRATSPKTQMPQIASWIAELRSQLDAQFGSHAGSQIVDDAMRAGLQNGGFWAIENGFVVGAPPPDVIRKAHEACDER